MPNVASNSVRALVRLSAASGLTGLLLGIGLPALGSKGDKLLAALTFALAAATPPTERLLDAWFDEEDRRIRLPQGRRAWTLIVALTLGFGAVTYGTWPLWHKTDDNVTDQVKIVGGDSMRGGATTRINFPTPRNRDWLSLTLRLESKTSSGMCVDRAQLRLRPRVDGVAKQENTARSEVEVRTHLGEVERGVHVDVELAVPDEGCEFALRVDEAVFYNRRLPW